MAETDIEDIAGVNSVRLQGQLSTEPEFRQLPSGTVLGTIIMRVPSRPGSMTSIPVTVWDPGMDIRRLIEGDVVEVHARLRRRFWAGADGQRQSRLEVEGESVRRLS